MISAETNHKALLGRMSKLIAISIAIVIITTVIVVKILKEEFDSWCETMKQAKYITLTN